MESPYEASWFRRPWQDHRVTTQVDVATVYQRKKAALLAHATQIDPESPFWFALPDDIAATVHPWEEYHLARSSVEVEVPETDLFAGLRDLHRRRRRSGDDGDDPRAARACPAGPGGEVAYVVEVLDGAVVSTSLGADDTADLTLAERHDDAEKVAAGELGLDEAFMRGRAKLTGSMGTFMALLPVFRGDAYRAAEAAALGGTAS